MTGSSRRRVLAPIGLALAGLFLLTGCLTYVDRGDVPAYSLIYSSDFSERPWNWVYLDSEGEEQELHCEDRVCDSADGSVHMEYSNYRSRISIEKLTVNGGPNIDVERVRFEDMDGIRLAWVPQDYYDTLPKG